MVGLEVDERKSRAVISYVWSGPEPYPRTSEQAVVAEFGDVAGWELLSYAKSVVEEINEMPIDWSRNTLESATELYAASLRKGHPELSEVAVDILVRAFSYWFK